MDVSILSTSPEQTIDLGRQIGRQLRGGEVFGICGPLGSGKTHLIKGIAEGAGATDRTAVTSPTFVIINEYAGRLRLFHIDAYRLNSIHEFEMLGFDDMCGSDSVILIEWADKIEPALSGIPYTRIELVHAGPTNRQIRIKDFCTHIRLV